MRHRRQDFRRPNRESVGENILGSEKAHALAGIDTDDSTTVFVDQGLYSDNYFSGLATIGIPVCVAK